MILTLKALDATSARAVLTWQYPPPYDIYNADPADIEADLASLLDPTNHYYSVWNEDELLIGFRNFGPDARVPGGNYSLDALDLGGGLRPDLTGHGLGAAFMRKALGQDFKAEPNQSRLRWKKIVSIHWVSLH